MAVGTKHEIIISLLILVLLQSYCTLCNVYQTAHWLICLLSILKWLIITATLCYICTNKETRYLVNKILSHQHFGQTQMSRPAIGPQSSTLIFCQSADLGVNGCRQSDSDNLHTKDVANGQANSILHLL